MRNSIQNSIKRKLIVCILSLGCVALVFGSPLLTSKAKATKDATGERGNENQSLLPDLGIGASLNGARPFPVNNPWNQDVSRAPVHSNSNNLIGSIGMNTPVHPDFGTVYAGAPNGIPYIVVAGNQLSVPITFTAYGNQSDPGPYPVPTNAPIEGGPSSTGDRHVLVIDRDNWKLYEMFRSFPMNGGSSWEAGSGAVFALNSNAVRPEGWTSADAAGLPIFPGLVRYDEVFGQHEIRHALRFTAQPTRKAYVYPARHYASDNTSLNVPPMGMRVRLKASFITTGYSQAMQVILTGLKKYGMILADNGGNWFISGAPDMRWDDDELHTLAGIKGSDFEVVQTQDPLMMPNCDFDGDARTDLSVFRPATGTWFIQQSTNGSISASAFGIATDKLVPGDFDGDGITDVAVFRNGSWYSLNSSNGSFRSTQFGTSGDIPVPGDFDGDGKTDVAVFRQGQWYILQSSNGSIRGYLFGFSSDKPVSADFDGDGKVDVAVFRPGTGTWYVLQSSNGTLRAQQFGLSDDVPVQGDYDADGKTDVCVFRQSNGTWYFHSSQTGSLNVKQFGTGTDRPVPGDYDGDWKWDMAVYRPSEGTWYISNSYDGTMRVQQFGTSGDAPVPSGNLP